MLIFIFVICKTCVYLCIGCNTCGHTKTYKLFKMKWIFAFVLYMIMSLFMVACQSNSTKEKELELKERELELREKELKEKENESSNNESSSVEYTQPTYQPPAEIKVSKFVYVIFKVQEPKLHHTDSKYISGIDGISSSTTLPEINYVTYDDYIYTSEIKEISGYDENKQYEYMDLMEAKVRQQISYTNMNFDSEVFRNVRDREEQQKLKENEAKIVDRKLKVFDSYKEASIHRNNNKGKF